MLKTFSKLEKYSYVKLTPKILLFFLNADLYDNLILPIVCTWTACYTLKKLPFLSILSVFRDFLAKNIRAERKFDLNPG